MTPACGSVTSQRRREISVQVRLCARSGVAHPLGAQRRRLQSPAPTQNGGPMTDPSNPAIPMVGIRQDRQGHLERQSSGLERQSSSLDRQSSSAPSREHYESTTLDAPDVDGDNRKFVIKPRRYVEIQLDGAGGPVRIELSVEQAGAVGRALLDAAGKLDSPRSF